MTDNIRAEDIQPQVEDMLNEDGLEKQEPPKQIVTTIYTVTLAAIAVIGIICTITGFWKIGLVMVLISVGLAATSYFSLSANPVTAGFITFWNKPLTNSDGTVLAVKGDFFLPRVFPFLLDVVPVDMTVQRHDIKEDLMSIDPNSPPDKPKPHIKMKGSITLIGLPNIKHLDLFIAAGGWTEIWRTIDDLVIQMAKLMIAHHRIEYDEFSVACSKLAKAIQNILTSPKFEERWGIDLRWVRVDYLPPEDMILGLQAKSVKGLEREAESMLNTMIMKSALDRMMTYRDNGINKPLDECRAEILREKLIDDSKVTITEGAIPITKI